MRRITGDDGAVAVLVALLAIVLVAFGAMVIDVGALYAEKRQLQSGADAAALAITQDCASGTCPSDGVATAVATRYAGLNDRVDGAASASVCGTEWTACSVAESPSLPPGVKYVKVVARTQYVSEGVLLEYVPWKLGGVLSSGTRGNQVDASAVVAWGSPNPTGPSIPLIISACEWETWTTDGSDYASDPPYAEGSEPWSHETSIVTHDPQRTLSEGDVDCRAGGGFNYQISGGFGWLDTAGNSLAKCVATIDEQGEAASKQGNLPCADDVLAANFGTAVNIPIFAEEPVSHDYAVAGWARFFITGYYVNGMGNRGRHLLLEPGAAEMPSDYGIPPCITTPNEDCLTGFFLQPQASSGVPTGPSFGVTVTSLFE